MYLSPCLLSIPSTLKSNADQVIKGASTLESTQQVKEVFFDLKETSNFNQGNT